MKHRKRLRKSSIKRARRRQAPHTADEFFALPEQFQSDWDDTLRVISKMRTDGLSLKKAAKQEGVNPRTVTQWGRQALRKRKNRSYSVTERDSLLRVMNVITPEGPIEVGIRSSKDARLLGSYWTCVQRDLYDPAALSKFKGKSIKDSEGKKYELITDRKELRRLRSAGVLSFESIYARVA